MNHPKDHSLFGLGLPGDLPVYINITKIYNENIALSEYAIQTSQLSNTFFRFDIWIPAENTTAWLGFSFRVARLGLASSLLANHFCTAVLVIKGTPHISKCGSILRRTCFFFGFKQLRRDVIIIISASCLSSSKLEQNLCHRYFHQRTSVTSVFTQSKGLQ